MLKNETLILRILSHPGIIQIHEVYQQPDKVVIIMDYVHGCDLYTLLKDNKRIEERQAAILLYHISDALQLITESGFCHRDLKLENVLVSNPVTLNIKIVDFGFAEQIDTFKLKSKAGTPGYIPPEIFKGLPYTSKGDVFSLGVILYSLIGGYSPFRGPNYDRVMMANKNADLEFNRLYWDTVSAPCKDLLKQMLEPIPQKRISIQQVQQHEFLKVQLGEDLTQLLNAANNLKVKEFYKEVQFNSQQREQLDEYEMMIGGQVRSFFIRSNYSQSGRSMRSAGLSQRNIEELESSLSKQRSHSAVPSRSRLSVYEKKERRQMENSTHSRFEMNDAMNEQSQEILNLPEHTLQFLTREIFNMGKLNSQRGLERKR